MYDANNSYARKKSTLKQNPEGWVGTSNNSELGDWKDADSININGNPIYDIKLSTTDQTTQECKELQLKEMDSLIISEERVVPA